MIDFATRIASMEKALFGGPNPEGLSTITQPAVVPPVVYTGSADALAYPGRAILAAAALDSATLPTPVPGTDDGKVITILNAAAFANTVTTAAGKIVNGGASAFQTITFAAHNGGSIELMAFNGLWYVINTPVNASLS